MNAINKLLLAIFTLATALTSCSSWIYDNPEDCPQGVYLKYYAKSACEQEIPSFYSDFGKAASLTIFAFNQQDKLVSWKQVDNVDLTRDYYYLYDISNGNYKFHTWVNATKAQLEQGEFKVGVTTPYDLGFTMQRKENGTLANIDTAIHVFHGLSDSVAVLPDPKVVHTEWYDTVYTALIDQTKKVRVTLEGVHPDSLAGMEVYLEASNYFEYINGAIDNTPRVERLRRQNYNYRYLPGDSIDVDSTRHIDDDYYIQRDSTVSFDFKTLTLNPYSDYKLVIKTPAGTTLFTSSLVGKILVSNEWSHINTDCDYQFHVRFRVRSYRAMSVDVIIGDWIVHGYEIDLRKD